MILETHRCFWSLVEALCFAQTRHVTRPAREPDKETKLKEEARGFDVGLPSLEAFATKRMSFFLVVLCSAGRQGTCWQAWGAGMRLHAGIQKRILAHSGRKLSQPCWRFPSFAV